jgi:hypothetical protein
MANNEENLLQEEWFTLDDIQPVECQQELYCIAVDSPAKQFLAGRLGIPTHNTEEGKAEDELKGEATMIIGSIARLGRAAGVHLIVATQRPDAAILPGEVKANLGVRINCGRTDTNASSMILGTSDGVRVKANPRGRLFVRIYGNGDHGQGFFAQPSWIDEYLAKHGQNPDGSPIAQPRSKLANITGVLMPILESTMKALSRRSAMRSVREKFPLGMRTRKRKRMERKPMSSNLKMLKMRTRALLNPIKPMKRLAIDRTCQRGASIRLNSTAPKKIGIAILTS